MNHWFVQVPRILLRPHGGETITRRVDKVKWSQHRIPTWAELAEKFHYSYSHK